MSSYKSKHCTEKRKSSNKVIKKYALLSNERHKHAVKLENIDQNSKNSMKDSKLREGKRRVERKEKSVDHMLMKNKTGGCLFIPTTYFSDLPIDTLK